MERGHHLLRGRCRAGHTHAVARTSAIAMTKRLCRLIILLCSVFREHCGEAFDHQSAARTTFFYVQSWREPGSVSGCVPMDASDRVCNATHPCSSLQAAFETVWSIEHRWGVPSGRSHDPLAEQQPGPIVIQLLPSNQSQCRVFLSHGCSATSTAENSSKSDRSSLAPGLEIDSRRVANVVVNGRHTEDGCQRTILVPPTSLSKQPMTTMGYHITIRNSSLITFQNIEVKGPATTSAKGSDSTGLVYIEESALVKFASCDFNIDYSKVMHSHVAVRNSVYVIFDRCHFKGAVLPTPSKKSGDRGVALAVEYDTYPLNLSSHEESYVQTFFANLPAGNKPENISSRNWQSSCGAGDWTACMPAFLLHKSSMIGIGEALPTALSMFNTSHLPKATALSVIVSCNPNVRVLLHSCLIQGNSAPDGTPVLLQMKGSCLRPAPETPAFQTTSLIHIYNTMFSNNWALIGGGLAVDEVGYMPSKWLILIEECVFTNNRAHLAGGAIKIQQHEESVHDINDMFSCIHMVGTQFDSNVAKFAEKYQHGGAVSITVSPGKSSTAQRSPSFSNCLFQCCQGGKREKIQIRFHNSNICNNSGDGGVYLINTYVGFSGDSIISGNRGSGMVLQDSLVIFKDNVSITSNRASFGGAFNIKSSSRVDLHEVKYLHVEKNFATTLGGVAYADHDSSTLPFLSAMFYRKSKRNHSRGCPFRLPASLTKKETEMLLMNNGGVGWQADTTIIFLASLYSCFDEYAALFPHLFDVQDPRYCMPYGPARWELTEAAPQPCDVDYCSVTRVYTTNGSCLESCASLYSASIADRSSCQYGSKPLLNETTAICYTAASGGHPLCNDNKCHANGTIGTCLAVGIPSAVVPSPVVRQGVCSFGRANCKAANPYLLQPGMCYSTAQKVWVINSVEKTRFRSKPVQFASMVAWLSFDSSSASCYKHVGEEVWYFYRHCRRQHIYTYLKNSRKRKALVTDCVLLDAAKHSFEHRLNMPPVLPGYEILMTPWASLLHRWDSSLNEKISNTTCPQDEIGRFAGVPDRMSGVVLHPAPGEEFSVSVSALDQMFNHRRTVLHVAVKSDEEDVIFAHEGFMFKRYDEELFTSLKFMDGLTLYGPPGASGNLTFQVQKRLTVSDTNGERLVLVVPFRLRKCHFGFRWTGATSTEAQDLVKKFNSAENNDEISIVKNRIKSLLSCQCRNTTDNCVTQCFSGKYVGIHRTCWAGRKGTSDNSTASYRRPTMVRYTVNDFFERDGGDPVGKFEQEGDPFAAAVCSKESCSLHNGSRTWILGEEDPCHKGFHLVGPLCTVCARNYTVSMGTLFQCRQEGCGAGGGVSWASFFIILLVVFTLAFIVLLFLNVGVTPAFDSWLFFAQVYFSITGCSHQVIRSFYAHFITLGVARLCVTTPITVFQRQTSFMAPGLMGLSLLLLFYFVAGRVRFSLRFLQMLQHRNSIRHVLWLVILWSTGMLTYLSLMIVRCTRLGSDLVSSLDGTVLCFRDGHTPYAAFALVVLVTLVLPVPVLLVWKPTQRWPCLVGMIDEATSIYQSKYEWWVSINILRRILFAVVTAFEITGQVTQSIVCLLILQLATHGYLRPYRRDKRLWKLRDSANVLECVSLSTLLFIGVYTIMQVDNTFGPSERSQLVQQLLFVFISALQLGVYMFEFVRSWRNTIARRPRYHLSQLWRLSEDVEGDDSTVESRAHRRQRRLGPDQNNMMLAGRLSLADQLRVEDTSDVDTSLREPLLFEELTRVNDYSNGS